MATSGILRSKIQSRVPTKVKICFTIWWVGLVYVSMYQRTFSTSWIMTCVLRYSTPDWNIMLMFPPVLNLSSRQQLIFTAFTDKTNEQKWHKATIVIILWPKNHHQQLQMHFVVPNARRNRTTESVSQNKRPGENYCSAQQKLKCCFRRLYTFTLLQDGGPAHKWTSGRYMLWIFCLYVSAFVF